jgi:hypothetical protein
MARRLTTRRPDGGILLGCVLVVAAAEVFLYGCLRLLEWVY